MTDRTRIKFEEICKTTDKNLKFIKLSIVNLNK